jgi:transcriptional regulator with XRE-family HTH domain
MVKKLDFGFASPDEVCAELGDRIKAARLAQGLQQAELAARAGVSRGTLVKLENTGQSTVGSLVRVAMALGLVDQLAPLFELQVHSIADMVQRHSAPRQRVRKAAVLKGRAP